MTIELNLKTPLDIAVAKALLTSDLDELEEAMALAVDLDADFGPVKPDTKTNTDNNKKGVI